MVRVAGLEFGFEVLRVEGLRFMVYDLGRRVYR